MLIGAHNGRDYALFFRQPIPQDVAQDATLIEAARAKYAELSYTKQGLQTFFLATLLVAALLAIFLALVMALYFAAASSSRYCRWQKVQGRWRRAISARNAPCSATTNSAG